MKNESVYSKQPLTIHGEVKHINRLDIDKSGRNPKSQVTIHLAPTKIEGEQINLDSNSLIKLQAKEQKILEDIDKLPAIGDNLIVESYKIEDQQRIFPIRSIKIQL